MSANSINIVDNSISSPPQSPTLSNSSSAAKSGMKRRHSPALSLDLSDLPSLIQPSSPSNTLIITNLSDPTIFHPTSLQTIRDILSVQGPIHSFAPLKSFRRIIVVFETIETATHLRQLLDGETILGNRVRVYFGEPTELEEKDQHLAAPQSQKLFFISPPPSPPVGWESRLEEAPNKDVHADDLISALDKLNAHAAATKASEESDFVVDRSLGGGMPPSPTSLASGGFSRHRSRSGTIVFDPVEQGGDASLPAIAVEDTSDETPEQIKMGLDNKAFVHTSRPPVELME